MVIHVIFLLGTRKLVLIGDKLVDYNSEFRLYLVCRDAKISIPSYFATLFTIVDFEITYSSLSQQVKMYISLEIASLAFHSPTTGLMKF